MPSSAAHLRHHIAEFTRYAAYYLLDLLLLLKLSVIRCIPIVKGVFLVLRAVEQCDHKFADELNVEHSANVVSAEQSCAEPKLTVRQLLHRLNERAPIRCMSQLLTIEREHVLVQPLEDNPHLFLRNPRQ